MLAIRELARALSAARLVLKRKLPIQTANPGPFFPWSTKGAHVEGGSNCIFLAIKSLPGWREPQE